jgi:flagellum-specific ATP synthase
VESTGPNIGLGACGNPMRQQANHPAEVIGFKASNWFCFRWGYIDGISPGDSVVALNQPRTILLDPSLKGRVLDGLGRPIRRGPLKGTEKRSIDTSSPPPLTRR